MGAPRGASGGRRPRSLARRCVAQALYQWQMTGHDGDSIDLDFLRGESQEQIDQRYFETLLRGVITHVDLLDDLLGPLLDRPIAEVDPVERAILRMGACELRFHPEVPFRVVINEAVETAKRFGAHHGHKYVNGILDRLAEQLRAEEIAIMSRK